MKCVLLLLVVIEATFTSSYAQTTSGSVFPIATTDCGKRAVKCWRDVKPAMDEADSAFDFAKGCRQFMSFVSCLNAILNDPLCTSNSEVSEVSQGAIADRNGLCFTNGSLTACGTIAQTCMGEVVTIINDYQRKNATAACTLQGKLDTCQANVNDQPDCPGKVKQIVSTAATSLLEAQLLTGCDGACGVKFGACMDNITNIIASGDFINLVWSTFCSVTYAALDCLNTASKSADCAGNQEIASMLDSQNRVLGDYCASRGQPSACIQQLQQCTSDWKAVGTSVSVQTRCQADAIYLECSSKIPCATQVQPVLIGLRRQIDDTETSTQCPIVGSCADRIDTCNSLSQDLINAAMSQAICDLTKTAVSCFNFVRSDAICSNENIPKSDFEIRLPAIIVACQGATFATNYAQITTGFPFPIATTDCGNRTVKCWRGVKPAMDEADTAFDFSKGCRQFKIYMDCVNDVLNDPNCASNTEVPDINQKAIGDRNGLCFTNGSLTACGTIAQTCMGEVVTVINDYTSKNATAACTLQSKLVTCQSQVTSQSDCPDKFKQTINTADASLLLDTLLTGCDGTCGVKFGACMNNITNRIASEDFINVVWSSFCSDTYKALDCLSTASTSADCAGSPEIASMLDSQNSVLGAYCASRGQPSACIQQLEQCTSDWKAVGTSVSAQARCQADAMYLECSSKIPCATQVQPVLIGLRRQIDDTETSTQCPIVGSCKERIFTCNSLSQDSTNAVKSQAACDLTKTALSCFDFVRSDAICGNENIPKSAFEIGLPGNLDATCDDACADKLSYCSFWEGTLQTIDKNSQGSQYCRLAQSGNSCFSKVRTDPTCRSSTIPKSSFEESLATYVSSTCAAGELVASVFLVFSIVLLSVLRFL